MTEVWKDIVGYEGLYQVSNQGNVRSLDRVSEHNFSGKITLKGTEKKPSFDGKYLFVVLSKEGKRKQITVHRLVAEAERVGGFDHRGISRCATGQRNKAYGYVWKYKEAN